MINAAGRSACEIVTASDENYDDDFDAYEIKEEEAFLPNKANNTSTTKRRKRKSQGEDDDLLDDDELVKKKGGNKKVEKAKVEDEGDPMIFHPVKK